MYNADFFSLINFQTISKLTFDDSMLYLDKILNTPFNNSNSTDIIDYPRLIYIELTYGNYPSILEKVAQLKHMIADNYQTKEKVMTRLTLKTQNDFEDKDFVVVDDMDGKYSRLSVEYYRDSKPTCE